MRTQQSRTRSSLRVLVGALTAWTLATTVFAVDIIDDPAQIDERATRVIQTTNILCWEMNRYHKQQPDYAETYQAAKEIWSQAGQLHDALRSGPVETEVMRQQLTEMNKTFAQIEKTMLTWGSGDRSIAPATGTPTQRTVVRPGVEVDIPFVGFRVGGPQVVVTEESPAQIPRKRLHPNSPGSKRSLERELFATKLALSYLFEDANVNSSSQPNSPATDGPSELGPKPQAQTSDSTLKEPQKGVVPPAKKSETESVPK